MTQLQSVWKKLWLVLSAYLSDLDPTAVLASARELVQIPQGELDGRHARHHAAVLFSALVRSSAPGAATWAVNLVASDWDLLCQALVRLNFSPEEWKVVNKFLSEMLLTPHALPHLFREEKLVRKFANVWLKSGTGRDAIQLTSHCDRQNVSEIFWAILTPQEKLDTIVWHIRAGNIPIARIGMISLATRSSYYGLHPQPRSVVDELQDTFEHDRTVRGVTMFLFDHLQRTAVDDSVQV